MSGNFFAPRVPEITMHRLFNAGTRTRVEFARGVLKRAAASNSMTKYWGQNSEAQHESLLVTVDRKNRHLPEKSHYGVLPAEQYKELSDSCVASAWVNFNNSNTRVDEKFLQLEKILTCAIGVIPHGFYLVRTKNSDLIAYAATRREYAVKQLRLGVTSDDNWVGILQEYLSMLVFDGLLATVDIRDQSEYELTAKGMFPLRPSLKFIGTAPELDKLATWFAKHDVNFEPIAAQVRPMQVHFCSVSSDLNTHNGVLLMGDSIGALPALKVSGCDVNKIATLIAQHINIMELSGLISARQKLMPGR